MTWFLFLLYLGSVTKLLYIKAMKAFFMVRLKLRRDAGRWYSLSFPQHSERTLLGAEFRADAV